MLMYKYGELSGPTLN